MISIKINDLNFLVKPHISILEACKYVGITIPRFCYHETLSVAGNCRMCLVELEGLEKPVASCVTEIDEGMSIWVDTPYVKKARENVVETLLINHPLDCPICDQAGECDLQDQTKAFGSDHSRYFFNKRGVEDKNCGPLIKTIMTRCIHCTRCVRFGSEIAGIDFLGTLNRGTSTEIGSYVSKMFKSEISGNVIDLCPVGALTSKPYAFKTRPWELRLNESIDITDGLGSNIYVNFKESEVFRILPKSNGDINEGIISDKARFSYDAINNNRIKNLFEKKSSKFEKINWSSFFLKFDSLIENNKKVNVIIDDELDLINLNILKKVNNKYLNNIKISTISSTRKKNNFFISNLTDKVNDIEVANDVCFLFSANPKVESTVLNARIRFKYKNNKFEVFCFGQSFSTNIPSTFVSLNIENILKIVEGKSRSLSSLLLSTKSPLFVIGESFNTRFFGTTELIKFFYQTFYNVKIINISLFSNTQGIVLQNIDTLNTKKMVNSTYSIAVNLDDTLKVRNSLNNKAKPFIWLNSHGSNIALNSNLIVPTLTSFENEEVYINLEQRPQKTQKTFESFFDARGTNRILLSAFNLSNNFSRSKSSYLDYIFEIINTPKIFNKTIKKLSLLFLKDISNGKSLNIFLKYPFKSILEDFYTSNKFSKNSFIMNKCSREYRKIKSNFDITNI